MGVAASLLASGRCSFGSSLSLRGTEVTCELLVFLWSLLFREQPFIEGTRTRISAPLCWRRRCSFGSSLSLRDHSRHLVGAVERGSLLFREQPFIEGDQWTIGWCCDGCRCSFGSSLSLRGCHHPHRRDQRGASRCSFGSSLSLRAVRHRRNPPHDPPVAALSGAASH